MSVLSVLFLGAIAVLLFYKVVTRRHKILLAKIVIALALCLLVIAAVLVLVDKRREARESAILRSVSVRYVPNDNCRQPTVDSTVNPFDCLGDRSDTLKSVSFELCNRGSDSVSDVTFFPITRRTGRSTEHLVGQRYVTRLGELVLDESYSDNIFHSDYILAPAACTTLVWSGGSYIVLDSVVVSNKSVTLVGATHPAP